MLAGPETARLLTEYEEKHSRKKKESERHYEQIPSVQKTFLAQTKNVLDVMEGLGNPFAGTSTDLYNRECAFGLSGRGRGGSRLPGTHSTQFIGHEVMRRSTYYCAREAYCAIV